MTKTLTHGLIGIVVIFLVIILGIPTSAALRSIRLPINP